MAGRLIEPKVITDFNQELVCVLPKGFWFDDVRWQKVWAAFDEKGATLSMADLREIFPDEEVLYEENQRIRQARKNTL